MAASSAFRAKKITLGIRTPHFSALACKLASLPTMPPLDVEVRAPARRSCLSRVRGTCTKNDETRNGDNNNREAKLRVESKKPKQPLTWIPRVIQLFNQKAQLTSQELAVAVGKHLGGDAVTRCRQVGLPITPVGFAPGSDRTKLYTLDVPFLWLALEEAVQQINRYALILNSEDQSAQCPTFRTMAMWIQHVHLMEKTRRKPGSQQKSS